MKKQLLASITILTLSMASSMSVLAAPKIMPDGGVFDSEYYAQKYALENYFNDVSLEKFSSFDDLVKFVESVDLYKYVDEVTFANKEEFFADSFEKCMMEPEKMKATYPEIYEYILKCIDGL